MKMILRLEELAMFLLSIYVFSLLPFAWWWFPLLLLTPDVGMVGYLINTQVGAFAYNFLHNKILAIVLFGLGLFFQSAILQLIGVILFAHAAMDRFAGYGLKYNDSFRHTHLGRI